MKQMKNMHKNKIIIMDGAMGTMIQSHKLSEVDYRGEKFKLHPCDLKGNNDILSLTQPHIIQKIHETYLNAGANIIETNTFNANAISQSDYELENFAYEMNLASAKIAKKSIKNKADEIWSLSKMTLPHSLVRIVIIEQIYRAWSIISRHPYHRE